MAVYRSTPDPNMMLSFSLLLATEKLQLMCMPWQVKRQYNIVGLGDQPRSRAGCSKCSTTLQWYKHTIYRRAVFFHMYFIFVNEVNHKN